MTNITEQLSLPLCAYSIVYGQAATSSTFTMTYGTCLGRNRDEILRDNIRRAWAGISLIAMFAVPIGGIFLL